MSTDLRRPQASNRQLHCGSCMYEGEYPLYQLGNLENSTTRCLTPLGIGRLNSGIPNIIPNLPVREDVDVVGQAKCPDRHHPYFNRAKFVARRRVRRAVYRSFRLLSAKNLLCPERWKILDPLKSHFMPLPPVRVRDFVIDSA